jgi:hypothetical protein
MRELHAATPFAGCSYRGSRICAGLIPKERHPERLLGMHRLEPQIIPDHIKTIYWCRHDRGNDLDELMRRQG